MKFLVLAALFAGVLAVPTHGGGGGGGGSGGGGSGGGGGGGGGYKPCEDGLFSNPQCCSTDVLGVADLDCASPPQTPTSANNFKNICASGGNQARCCVLPLLNLGVLCKKPTGVN